MAIKISCRIERCHPFEQWSDDGSQDMQQRAFAKWKKMLNEYKIPTIDEAVDEALLDFIARRKTSMADAWY